MRNATRRELDDELRDLAPTLLGAFYPFAVTTCDRHPADADPDCPRCCDLVDYADQVRDELLREDPQCECGVLVPVDRDETLRLGHAVLLDEGDWDAETEQAVCGPCRVESSRL